MYSFCKLESLETWGNWWLMENDDEGTTVLLMKEEFFDDPGFSDRFTKQVSFLRSQIYQVKKEEIRPHINSFFEACFQIRRKEDEQLQMLISYFDLLNEYVQQYKCLTTLENIQTKFSEGNIKERLLATYPIRTKLVYAQTKNFSFTLKKALGQIDASKKKFIEPLIVAKSYLISLYNQHLDGRISLNDRQLSRCLTSLAYSYAQLSRWSETMYYLDLSDKTQSNTVNSDFLRAVNLEAVKNNTCSDYNGQLLLAIIDSCSKSKRQKGIFPEMVSTLDNIEKKQRIALKENNIPISKLRKHKKGTVKDFAKYGEYVQFCLNNRLFLTEHSFYCSCKRSTRDDIEIRTSHEHTRIPWVDQFSTLLEIMIYDFLIARKNFFDSLNGTKLIGYHLGLLKRNQKQIGIKNSALKLAFKECYSILDKIAHGILQVLDIKPNDILHQHYKSKENPNWKPPKLDFLNMWDFPLITDEHFSTNIYLQPLYSISRDISNHRKSPLRDFKDLRNAIEHRYLLISDEDYRPNISGQNSILVIDRSAMIEKAKVLLVLTKSAIFSFTYLVRVQSISKAKGTREKEHF